MHRFRDRRDGFYVDVGAFHPFTFSNTCLLYHRGWSGLNIEPDPEAIALFKRHRPRDVNLQVAVGSEAGEAQFSRSGAFAGIDTDDYLWPDIEAARISVGVLPLAAILQKHLPSEQHIDLLDVDCEGQDLDVLRSNDWQRFQPEVVLAESHGQAATARITEFMDSVGYRAVTQFDLTLVFEKRLES